MGRPNRDMVMITMWLSRVGKAAVHRAAAEREESDADTTRAMLAYAQRHMPKEWKP